MDLKFNVGDQVIAPCHPNSDSFMYIGTIESISIEISNRGTRTNYRMRSVYETHTGSHTKGDRLENIQNIDLARLFDHTAIEPLLKKVLDANDRYWQLKHDLSSLLHDYCYKGIEPRDHEPLPFIKIEKLKQELERAKAEHIQLRDQFSKLVAKL